MTDKRKIVIIGTGGTIAGKAASNTDLTGYQAGTLPLTELLADIPELAEYGPFETEQFSNIESSDITVQQWRALSALAQKKADRQDVAGVVITHGTDSMEETSYFLHLTVQTDKPIIFTGSMRPASAISADGPLNILSAVQTARSPEACGKGVMIVMNNYIDSARYARKMNTTNAATFGNQDFGHMGIIQQGTARFFTIPAGRHTNESEFTRIHEALPRVELLFAYAGMTGDVVEAIAGLEPAGLVVAGLGHGTLPKEARLALEQLTIPVVRASRTGSGLVTAIPSDLAPGFLTAQVLSPFKARILLMLGLAAGASKEELRRMFAEY